MSLIVGEDIISRIERNMIGCNPRDSYPDIFFFVKIIIAVSQVQMMHDSIPLYRIYGDSFYLVVIYSTFAGNGIGIYYKRHYMVFEYYVFVCTIFYKKLQHIFVYI